jgi:hypothetical protein
MNWVDLLLVLIVLGTIFWGMFRGAVRQLIGLLGLYVAIVASLWLYPGLAILIGRLLPNLTQNVQATIAFLFLFTLISNIVSAMLRFVLVPPPEERKRKKPGEKGVITEAVAKTTQRFILAPLNLLGGMAFAFISVCIWISLVMAVLRYALPVPWLAYDGIRAFMLQGILESRLSGLFDQVLQIAYTSVRPFVPRTVEGELPAIFSGQLQPPATTGYLRVEP